MSFRMQNHVHCDRRRARRGSIGLSPSRSRTTCRVRGLPVVTDDSPALRAARGRHPSWPSSGVRPWAPGVWFQVAVPAIRLADGGRRSDGWRPTPRRAKTGSRSRSSTAAFADLTLEAFARLSSAPSFHGGLAACYGRDELAIDAQIRLECSTPPGSGLSWMQGHGGGWCSATATWGNLLSDDANSLSCSAPASGSTFRVAGHFDDVEAQACRGGGEAGAVADAVAVCECRTRFVATSWSGIGARFLPRGPAQPHPRPVRDPRRARHRRHPADGADDRAREHPARRRGPALAAVEDVLGNAAQRDGDFIVVPAILDGEGRAADRAATADPRSCPRAGRFCASARSRRARPRRRTSRPAERQNHALNAWLSIDRERALGRPTPPTPAAAARARARALDRSTRCSASRSRSRTSSRSPAASAPRARGSSRATARTTPTSRSACATPARSSSARRTWTSSRWARPPSTARTGRSQPVGPRRVPGRQQRRLGGGRRRLPRAARCRHRHRRLDPAAGGAVRHRRHEADVRPGVRYGIVAFASSLDQIGPFARDRATRPRCSTRSPAATTATARARRTRARRAADAAVGDDEAASPAARQAPRPAARVLRGRHGAGRRGADPRGGRRARGRRRDVEEVSLPHTDYGLATYYIVAPAEASANLARYDGVRYGQRLGGATCSANYLATRGEGFGPEVKRRIMLGTYALSAGYYDAYYLKAQKVRTLIKRDFDALWEQASTRSSRRRRRPSPSASARAGRPGRDVPVGRLHAAGQHGRAARHLDPVRPVRGAAGRAAAHRRGLVGAELFRLARGYEAITAEADGGRWSRPTWP